MRPWLPREKPGPQEAAAALALLMGIGLGLTVLGYEFLDHAIWGEAVRFSFSRRAGTGGLVLLQPPWSWMVTGGGFVALVIAAVLVVRAAWRANE